MRLRICRFCFSLGVSSSFFGMTICFWDKSPITTALSASRCAIRLEALCRQSRCLRCFFSETRLYTLVRWIYRRGFFLLFFPLERILYICPLYPREPFDTPILYESPQCLEPLSEHFITTG